MHKFNPENKGKLDNPERRKLLPPEEVLLELGLKKGQNMADIGCGIGYFTIPAGEIVGREAKVYGVDILEEMLRELDQRLEKKGIYNVEKVKSEEYDLKIRDEKIDFALMVNVLHEIEEKEKFLREVNRIVRENGRIAIIDYHKRETKMGPPLEDRISMEDAIGLFHKTGFKFKEMYEYGNIYYAIIGIKTINK